MKNHYTTKAKHLTIDSRRLIERWKKEGKSNREIASLLGKAPQTFTMKSSVGQSDNVLEKDALKRFILRLCSTAYENNRKRSVKKSRLNKELKE
ncbi:DNA-binding helix-turn-helix protein, partial [Streptococcus pseudopneumoniae SK674]